jgi:hypothetical protein
MAPYQVFCEYLAIKSHFSNVRYDYFKYNKKVRATESSFKKRKDIYWFQKTSRKYHDKEIVDFLVSNFVATDNPQNLWIGSIINSGERNYSEWMKRQQSLTYLFKEQSEELLSEIKLEDAFNCSKGHPPILKKYLAGKIGIETLVIYDIMFKFANVFDKKLLDPIWETVSLKISKYKPFLNINVFNYKQLLREIVNE